MKRIVSVICIVLFFVQVIAVDKVRAEEVSEAAVSEVQSQESAAVNISAPSAILMEASTGTVIFEKASSEQLRPASITKIMTLILIFDALKEGRIKLEDTVTTSEYAASMGGSQVFLEPQEQQSVDTMIKCIAVASANDACVAYMLRSIFQCLNSFKFLNKIALS